MPKHNLGFKYHIGQYVTHKGDLEPTRQPVVPRYTVISQLLETGPGGPQRFYYLSREKQQSLTHGEHIRASEAHLAPVPGEDG